VVVSAGVLRDVGDLVREASAVSTRRTIAVRLRLAQLEEVVNALDAWTAKLEKFPLNGAGRKQLKVAQSARIRSGEALLELLERVR
jgi:hypothetical protein